MAKNVTGLTWLALEALFANVEKSRSVLADESSKELMEYLLGEIDFDDPLELNVALVNLQSIAIMIVNALDHDLKRLSQSIKSFPVLREFFTPSEARVLIQALESGNAPILAPGDLIVGIYLVLKTGERDLKNLTILDFIAAMELKSNS